MIAQSSESTSLPNRLAAIHAYLQRLSPDRQQQVLDSVQVLARKQQPLEKTIWDKIDQRMAKVPVEALGKVPEDGSYQHDHYLYARLSEGHEQI